MGQTFSEHAASSALQDRLLMLWERTNDPALLRMAHGEAPSDDTILATEQDRSDWLSTSLMNTYKNTGDAEVFALLFELNRASFQQAIRGYLRHGHAAIDGEDILQEVVLNICRYPHRFLPNRANAFRGWAHRIVRNMAMHFIKGQARLPTPMDLTDENLEFEDPNARPSVRIAEEHETAGVVNHAYVLCLGMYLQQFRQLSAKAQRVMTLAEVERRPYRDIASVCGIDPASVKMMVFRSRKRIFSAMTKSLHGLARPDLSVAFASATD